MDSQFPSDVPLSRARLALEGLSVGDAFGERFFAPSTSVAFPIAARAFPAPPWHWTDDTAMALSVYESLRDHGRIDCDSLARAFGERYQRDPHRCYGATAHEILAAIAAGEPWRQAAQRPYDGAGSMGNGGAMRAAPVGAYFAHDLSLAADQARASAQPTHAHHEGQAGAVAVGVAAAIAWRCRNDVTKSPRADLLKEVASRTPEGPTREGICRAANLPLSADVSDAVELLGNGSRVISSDTVPFALWCAFRHLDNFEEAMWQTVSGLGNRDTTCAIVGGIVALATGHEGIPSEFLAAREPIESTLNHIQRHAARGGND